MRAIPKPDEGEYAPYTIQYIGLLPDDGLVLDHMIENYRQTRRLVTSLPEERLTHRYAPGKWTIKEILLHIIDDERIYAYRTLRFARGDKTELPGFEQDDYTAASRANDRSLDSLITEFWAVRRATVTLFDGLDDEALVRSGIADGRIMSVRAAAYHIAGHELHHVNIIRERYLA